MAKLSLRTDVQMHEPSRYCCVNEIVPIVHRTLFSPRKNQIRRILRTTEFLIFAIHPFFHFDYNFFFFFYKLTIITEFITLCLDLRAYVRIL